MIRHDAKDVASKCCIEFKCNVEELLTINYGIYYITDEILSMIIQHKRITTEIR